MRISLEREEVIALVVMLDKKKEFSGWEKSSYEKLLKALRWRNTRLATLGKGGHESGKRE